MKTNSKQIATSFKALPGRIKGSLRDSRVWGFLVGMAVCAIVSLAFFMPDNFQGHTMAQHDMQQGAANGAEARAFEQATGQKALWTNSLFSGMPTFQIAPEYETNGLFGWMNSVYGLGLPAPSNLMFMMMMGFLIMLTCLRLRWWVAMIGALAWGLSSYMVIIMGAGHIWKFMAMSYVPPTIGAVVMAYNRRYLPAAALMAVFAMLELNANHPQITYIFGYLMAILSAGFLVRAAIRRQWLQWLAATGVLLGAGLLAVGANLPSLYHTYEYAKETKRAASELTPLADPAADTPVQPAAKPTGGLPREEIGGWSNDAGETFALLIPDLRGGASIRPEGGQNRPLWLSEASTATPEMLNRQPVLNYGNGQYRQIDIFGQLTQYYGGKGMTNGPIYVGALIFALFIMGCFVVRGTLKWCLLAATLLSCALAMGNHWAWLSDMMIDNVPLFNKFRAAETWLVIAMLAMPMLAMLTLQRVADNGSKGFASPQMVRGFATGFGFTAFLCLAAAFSPGLFGGAITDAENEQFTFLAAQLHEQGLDSAIPHLQATIQDIARARHDMASADAWRSLAFVVLGGAVMWLWIKGKLKETVAATGLGALVVIDLYSVDKRYVSHESFTPDTSITDAAAMAPDAADRAIMQDTGYYRVLDVAAFGDARRSRYHHMVGGYHAAKLNRYNDLIERGLITHPAVMDMLNTRYIIQPGADGEPTVGTNPYALGAAWLVDNVVTVPGADAEFAALETIDPAVTAVTDKRFAPMLQGAPAPVAGDTVSLISHTPNTLQYSVDTRAGGVVVMSEIYFPWGWQATLDGKPLDIARVDYVLRAVKIPAGRHTLTLTFDPPTLHTTYAAAYTSITLIYLVLLMALFAAVIKHETPGER